VVSSFALATTVPERISTRSVNVPPMSTATRAVPTALLPLLVGPATITFYRMAGPRGRFSRAILARSKALVGRIDETLGDHRAG